MSRLRRRIFCGMPPLWPAPPPRLPPRPPPGAPRAPPLPPRSRRPPGAAAAAAEPPPGKVTVGEPVVGELFRDQMRRGVLPVRRVRREL